jgi:hypothetical protein
MLYTVPGENISQSSTPAPVDKCSIALAFQSTPVQLLISARNRISRPEMIAALILE